MKAIFLAAASFASASAMASPPCQKEFNQAWPLDTTLGNEYLSVDLNALASLTADCQKASFHANASSMGYVFDATLPLADTSLELTIDKASNKTLSADLTVLGFDLEGIDLTHSNQLDWEDSFELVLDQRDDIRFSYGPFSFPLEYGVSGIVALNASAQFTGLTAQASGVPRVDADAYVIAGVKSSFLVTQVEGDLLLIDANLNSSASLELSTDGEALYLDYDLDVTNRVDALSGNVSFMAYSPWAKNNVFERDLFSMDGYSLVHDIVNVNQSLKVN